MIDARFRPIETWPNKPTLRQVSAPFRTIYSNTLDLLEKELGYLGAKNIVIQAYFELKQIRNDGWPHSGSSPTKSGIIVSFESKRGAMSFPCDRFTKWHDNIRAIALGMEALRKIDRYGITTGSEQYKGWAQLPAGPPKMSAGDAAAFIANYASGVTPMTLMTHASAYREAYRIAARACHPDTGGNQTMATRLSEAKSILDTYHGL